MFGALGREGGFVLLGDQISRLMDLGVQVPF